jgi:hypothetical protein
VNQADRFLFLKIGLSQMRSTEANDRNPLTGCAEFAVEHLAFHGSGCMTRGMRAAACFEFGFREQTLARACIGRFPACIGFDVVNVTAAVAPPRNSRRFIFSFSPCTKLQMPRKWWFASAWRSSLGTPARIQRPHQQRTTPA